MPWYTGRKQEEQPGPEKQKHLTAIQEIIDVFADFIGEGAALARARKAPVAIDKEGNVTDFYGDVKTVIELVIEKYEGAVGVLATRRRLHRMMNELTCPELLPEHIKSGERIGIRELIERRTTPSG